MKRLIVLGANGMLGSEVVRVAEDNKIPVVAISRSSEIKFDAESMNFEQVAREIGLSEQDWLVNCIGWIPQKSSGEIGKDSRLAALLNTRLPEQLSIAKTQLGFNWIQIATDCVFNGDKGNYSENDAKDAKDLYGLSKIAGEAHSKETIQIRCSIVGRDSRTTSGIYSWFKSASAKATVNGYVDQHWNGVSTTAFARLSIGLLLGNWTASVSQHWLPRDAVSKFDLLQLFAKSLGLAPSAVVPSQTSGFLDRTLATKDQSASDALWEAAGYAGIPSIDELCLEFIAADRKIDFNNERR